jgi:hypothetical protein
MSKKNYNDKIGNRTSDLPVCRAVPEPTATDINKIRYKNCVVGTVCMAGLSDLWYAEFTDIPNYVFYSFARRVSLYCEECVCVCVCVCVCTHT